MIQADKDDAIGDAVISFLCETQQNVEWLRWSLRFRNEGTLVLTCRSDAAFDGVDSGPAKGPEGGRRWLNESLKAHKAHRMLRKVHRSHMSHADVCRGKTVWIRDSWLNHRAYTDHLTRPPGFDGVLRSQTAISRDDVIQE